MKTLISTLLITFMGALLAEPAWQYLPDKSDLEGILSTDDGLIALDSQGALLWTSNGESWEQVARLGGDDQQISVRCVLHPDNGLVVLVHGQGEVAGKVEPETWNRLYTTIDGLEWNVAIETRDNGDVAGPGLSKPYPYAGGWIVHTTTVSPAIIWHSVDLMNWMEIYRADLSSFQEKEYSSQGKLALRMQDSGGADQWLMSEDGLSWQETSVEIPSNIIEADGIYVGHSQAPGSAGVLYYSKDGEHWVTVGNPTGSRIGQRLYYTAGTFIFIQNQVQIHVSTNGQDWTLATVPEVLFTDWISARKSSMYHDARGFWYQIIEVFPPFQADKVAKSKCLFSADGLSWELVDAAGFPQESVDEVLVPKNNPAYTSPPGPTGDPRLSDPLLEREVQLAGYSLKTTANPDEHWVQVFIARPGEDYEVVNTSFGVPNAPYPYTAPLAIAASNNCLYVLNELGDLGVLNLDENYLAQPLAFTVSRGTFDDHIELTWQPVDGAAAYRIYRYSSDDASSVVGLAVVEGTNFSDFIDLEIDQLYHYQVQSLNGEQVSWLSEAAEGRLWSMKEDSQLINNCITGTWGVIYIDYEVGYSPDKVWMLSSADARYYPWVYTRDHGWQYCQESPGNIWLWDPQLGWLWTRKTYYPNLYLAGEKQWLRFLLKGEETRWFYRYSDGNYLPVD